MPLRCAAIVDTAHQQVQIWKSERQCEFRVAGAIHAWWHEKKYLTGLAWDNLAAASLLRPAGPPRSILMLGLAGGTAMRILRHLLPDCRLVAVDIDHAAAAGRDGRRDKGRANRDGLMQAARLIRLKGWGGLVAVDLVGTGHDGAAVAAAAKAAFGEDPEIAYGPVNRFGVLMLSLPWRTAPIEERLNGPDGRPTVETRAIDAVRRLKLALAGNTTAPYLTLRCPPAVAAAAGPLAARLGPRARVGADSTLSGDLEIDEG